MKDVDLARIAEKAGLSPTFVNWFEAEPDKCLEELYRFFKLKDKIIDSLEKELDRKQCYCSSSKCHLCSKWTGLPVNSIAEMLGEIQNNNIMSEYLF